MINIEKRRAENEKQIFLPLDFSSFLSRSLMHELWREKEFKKKQYWLALQKKIRFDQNFEKGKNFSDYLPLKTHWMIVNTITIELK